MKPPTVPAPPPANPVPAPPPPLLPVPPNVRPKPVDEPTPPRPPEPCPVKPVKPVPPRKPPRRDGPDTPRFTHGHLRVEPVPIPLERAQVRQQVALHNRQLLERHDPGPPRATTAAPGSDSTASPSRACPDPQRSTRPSSPSPPPSRRPSRIPSEATRRSMSANCCTRRATGCRAPPRSRSTIGRQIGSQQPSEVIESRAVAAVELHLEAEPLRAHVQRRQVDRLQLAPVAGRVGHGQLQRRVQVQKHFVLVVESRVLDQHLTPLGIVQLGRGNRSRPSASSPSCRRSHA